MKSTQMGQGGEKVSQVHGLSSGEVGACLNHANYKKEGSACAGDSAGTRNGRLPRPPTVADVKCRHKIVRQKRKTPLGRKATLKEREKET